MIYIYQDQNKIPAAWLAKVAALQAELEAFPTAAERKTFIDSKKAIWGEIKDKLLEMSHEKCWYSEAPDAVSDWHVDHFRPKNRALDEDRTPHEGYAWLAFDWKNYRIAGSYPNSPHTDDEGKTRGKWDYFPLGNGSPRANWNNRDFTNEICLILDPAKKNDPKLMTFDEEGVPIPSDPLNAISKKKVAVTVHYLFLDSPRLISARKKKWRETSDWIEEYQKVCPENYEDCTALDVERFERHIERLSAITGPEAAYAATARACLRANGLHFFIKSPEEAHAA
ncbi:MAG: hypothetical protein EOQ92_22985 [Mesorhizobium sp.]|uniref:hypothetical protein n=1 Tax=Mesorhizobium sp. TaxID=1871066 RepID=UPI000FE71470|nr:hypothetical protein [Mesorhizobium sp.]RWI18633.1 MAG: hypothetical protein EOQ92_22985 [Mesorhizobium sp.]RWK93389.1 MAG: hypothetical protein EOR53_23570 [Mesorhizobium sp.]TJW39334.1 MAG: hypothetical protein E5X59_29740 [Mesorhizobium sp.]